MWEKSGVERAFLFGFSWVYDPLHCRSPTSALIRFHPFRDQISPVTCRVVLTYRHTQRLCAKVAISKKWTISVLFVFFLCFSLLYVISATIIYKRTHLHVQTYTHIHLSHNRSMSLQYLFPVLHPLKLYTNFPHKTSNKANMTKI